MKKRKREKKAHLKERKEGRKTIKNCDSLTAQFAMPVSQKLRLAYVAEWLLAVSVSAAPVEHSSVAVEGDSSMAAMYGKREENPESMEQVVNDAVRLDHEIAHSRKKNRDSDGDGDSDKSEDGSDKSSVSLISLVLCFKLNSWFISSFLFWPNFCFMEE